jgi:hypothetical protein
MAKDAVAEYLVTRLRDWGVERVFGYPGDGINGIIWTAEEHPCFNPISRRFCEEGPYTAMECPGPVGFSLRWG